MAIQIGMVPASTSATVLPKPLIDDLDLTTLPDRLDNDLLKRVWAIATDPLPALSPCDHQQLSQALRMMLAVLPRRSADEISGELFVVAYQRELAAWPNEAVESLCRESIRSCQWFPTVAECLAILAGWRRDDETTRRCAQAAALARREHNQRHDERFQIETACQLTQADVDALSERMVSIGLGCGALIRDGEGNLRPAP